MQKLVNCQQERLIPFQFPSSCVLVGCVVGAYSTKLMSPVAASLAKSLACAWLAICVSKVKLGIKCLRFCYGGLGVWKMYKVNFCLGRQMVVSFWF